MRYAMSGLVTFAVVLAGCGGGSESANPAEPSVPEVQLSQAETEAINRGQGIAEGACATCHAIGPSDISKHGEAPPFRTIGQSYPIEALAEALAEGIVVGHPDMPIWEFVPEDVDGLLAYLESIQVQ